MQSIILFVNPLVSETFPLLDVSYKVRGLRNPELANERCEESIVDINQNFNYF